MADKKQINWKEEGARQVAWNPVTRKWQRVFEEDEVEPSKVVTEYWSQSSRKWFTIPQGEEE